MGYKTRVQVIRRKASRQWYVGLPAALAEALELEKGELIEWKIEDRGRILLLRTDGPTRHPETPAPVAKPLPDRTRTG